MDLHLVNTFFREHWLEIAGLFTLGLSLWVAFGPARHRLPRVLTRFGKYSATLKLLSLSGLCWFLLYKCLTDDEPSLALNWLLGSLGVVLLAGAAFVVTRKQEPAKHHAPHPHPPETPAQLPRISTPRSTTTHAGV